MSSDRNSFQRNCGVVKFPNIRMSKTLLGPLDAGEVS